MEPAPQATPQETLLAHLLLWCAGLVLVAYPFFLPGGMEAGGAPVFQYIGRQVAEGARLYRDVWDVHGPLLYLYHALGYMIGLHVLGAAARLLTLVLLYRGFRGGMSPFTAAFMGVGCMAFFCLGVDSGWNSVESLYFTLCAAVLAFARYSLHTGGKGLVAVFLGGAVAGLAVMAQPTLVGPGVFLLLFYLLDALWHKAYPLLGLRMGALLLGAVSSVAGMFYLVDKVGSVYNMLDALCLYPFAPAGAPGVLLRAVLLALFAMVALLHLHFHGGIRASGRTGALCLAGLGWLATELAVSGDVSPSLTHPYAGLALPLFFVMGCCMRQASVFRQRVSLLTVVVAVMVVPAAVPWHISCVGTSPWERNSAEMAACLPYTDAEYPGIATYGGALCCGVMDQAPTRTLCRYTRNRYVWEHTDCALRHTLVEQDFLEALRRTSCLLSEVPVEKLPFTSPEVQGELQCFMLVECTVWPELYLYWRRQ